MNRRSVLTAGAFAATLAFTGIATLADLPAAAEPVGGATAVGAVAGSAASTTDARVERARAYLDLLAKNLGTTPEELDAALRDTTAQMIDEAVAAGDLAANDAERLKQAVAASDVPMLPDFDDTDDWDDWMDDTSDDEEYSDRPAGAGGSSTGGAEATPPAAS